MNESNFQLCMLLLLIFVILLAGEEVRSSTVRMQLNRIPPSTIVNLDVGGTIVKTTVLHSGRAITCAEQLIQPDLLLQHCFAG